MDKPKSLTRSTDYTKAYIALNKSLLSYLRSKLDDYELAEDIVHEAFVKALSVEQENKINDLNAWIKRVVHNALVDHYRQKASLYPRSQQHPSEELAVNEQVNEEVNHIFAQFLRPFVERLPPSYATPILRKDFEGKSIRTIADELNISQSAVKSRLSRGRLKLRDDLQECCDIEVESGLVSNFHPKISCSSTQKA